MTAVAATTGTVDEQIGALVHQLMWQNRITQKAMADILGIQQSAMSRKLRGGRPWLAAEVVTVAHALGLPPGDLMPAGSGAAGLLLEAVEANTRRYKIGDTPRVMPMPVSASAA